MRLVPVVNGVVARNPPLGGPVADTVKVLACALGLPSIYAADGEIEVLDIGIGVAHERLAQVLYAVANVMSACAVVAVSVLGRGLMYRAVQGGKI